MGIRPAISILSVLALAALPMHSQFSKKAPRSARFSGAPARPQKPVIDTPQPALHFEWAGDFADGLAPVRVAQKYGYIDTSGNMRLAPVYEYAGGFSGRRAPVLVDGKWGYLDVTGRIAIAPAYAFAGPFREGLAPVADGDGYGFVDSTGALRVGTLYSDARPYSQGLAAVRSGDGEDCAWGFIDKRGNTVIPPLFTDVADGFSEGLALVRVEGEMPYRSGFIDSTGGFAIDTLYDAAGSFHEGLAPVGRGEWSGNRFRGRWGYVDRSGRSVIPLAFAAAGPFREGKALVSLMTGGSAWIARNGRILNAFRADLEITRPEGSAPVTYKLQDGYGFMDSLGNGLVKGIFQGAGTFHAGRARVRLVTADRSIWAYIDEHGRYLGGAVLGKPD